MGSVASCSSSSPPISNPKNYGVFISCRGDDTRTNFTGHLYTALSQNSVKTYIDYELPKGDDISESIFQAISDSCISVVVFSENFAFSRWCLEWRDSLFQASNLAGWDSRFFRDESELIRNIVNDVLQKLDYGHPSELKGFVGIHENCECIELLLEKAQIVGVWGMGGIGKTTIAKAVFAKLSPQYESCCFLENVREETEKHGLKYVRDNLVLELFKEENILNNSKRVLGSTAVSRRLSCRKVLIVLDDVNSSKQLEYLAQECDFLRKDSTVIITTRDKHLLVGRVDEIHEVMELKYQESYRLFNLKAFHNNHPDNGFEQLSQRAVDYAKGVPLALIVLGSFLYSKTKEEWDSALTKLKKTPNDDIQKVLKLSYDGLNYEEKEIFLDIACFLKGKDKEHVIRLLDSYGFHATIGLRALVDKALITMGDKVWMHDLIQEMGWEIIRQECIKEPGRRSRLWDSKEVYDVLEHNMGTTCVEGIMLNMSQIRDLHLNADTFKKMSSIRFLKFYSSWNSGSCNVHLPSGLESFSDKIRYFEWHGYPLKSLPSNFCAEKLVELNMQNSLIQTLWEGVQDFVNLKRLNLSR